MLAGIDRRSSEPKGFSAGVRAGSGKRQGVSKLSPALNKAVWGPLGKHPDLEAIIARQRLHRPLPGRLSELQVNQAWMRCAAAHNTMQLVNGARDLLLGRHLP